MPRPLRNEVVGAIYHATARGNRGASIVRDNADRRRFLQLLDESARRYAWTCLAYCLLDTHYHLLVRLNQPTFAAGMQHLNGQHAQLFNRRYRENGHLFGGRYYAGMISSEAHAILSVRYIALNPVRAGLCRAPEDWPWSSYSAVVARRPSSSVFAAEPVLELFDSDLNRAREFLQSFVGTGLEDLPQGVRAAA